MRIAKRRGVMIPRVAAARKLLNLIFYGLRDGEIRCLAGRPVEHGWDTATARPRRSTWPPSGEAGELSAARLAVAGTHHAP
jgi:hypothetical protein